MFEYQQPQKLSTDIQMETECPVSVFTEWDPLEEVIVGSIECARVPDWHVSIESVVPKKNREFFRRNSGRPFDADLIRAASAEVENLAKFLDKQGITVKRPLYDFDNESYVTPYFSSSGHFYSAMPRDGLFAIGNEIIETPMAWRNRYFETFPFREILKNYFKEGAKWTSAPKPTVPSHLTDDTF